MVIFGAPNGTQSLEPQSQQHSLMCFCVFLHIVYVGKLLENQVFLIVRGPSLKSKVNWNKHILGTSVPKFYRCRMCTKSVYCLYTFGLIARIFFFPAIFKGLRESEEKHPIVNQVSPHLGFVLLPVSTALGTLLHPGFVPWSEHLVKDESCTEALQLWKKPWPRQLTVHMKMN